MTLRSPSSLSRRSSKRTVSAWTSWSSLTSRSTSVSTISSIGKHPIPVLWIAQPSIEADVLVVFWSHTMSFVLTAALARASAVFCWAPRGQWLESRSCCARQLVSSLDTSNADSVNPRKLKPGACPVQNADDPLGFCSAADSHLAVYPTVDAAKQFW